MGGQVTARKKLGKMIKDAKKKAWKQLVRELESDIWGKAYHTLTREATCGSYKSKKLSIMVSFDVRNAFNSAPWNKILKTLETRRVSGYLIRMVESYFQNRVLVVGEERSEMVLGRGVPQGSVLAPLL